MAYERMHGQEKGIAERLKMWRRQLGTDKNYPWMGTGICDDLVTAARMLGADVSEFDNSTNQPVNPAVLEFDL